MKNSILTILLVFGIAACKNEAKNNVSSEEKATNEKEVVTIEIYNHRYYHEFKDNNRAPKEVYSGYILKKKGVKTQGFFYRYDYEFPKIAYATPLTSIKNENLNKICFIQTRKYVFGADGDVFDTICSYNKGDTLKVKKVNSENSEEEYIRTNNLPVTVKDYFPELVEFINSPMPDNETEINHPNSKKYSVVKNYLLNDDIKKMYKLLGEPDKEFTINEYWTQHIYYDKIVDDVSGSNEIKHLFILSKCCEKTGTKTTNYTQYGNRTSAIIDYTRRPIEILVCKDGESVSNNFHDVKIKRP